MKKTLTAQLVACAMVLGAGAASAQISDNSIRIGVLTDMSGI
jgi:hypothetical protein